MFGSSFLTDRQTDEQSCFPAHGPANRLGRFGQFDEQGPQQQQHHMTLFIKLVSDNSTVIREARKSLLFEFNKKIKKKKE